MNNYDWMLSPTPSMTFTGIEPMTFFKPKALDHCCFVYTLQYQYSTEVVEMGTLGQVVQCYQTLSTPIEKSE